MNTSLKEKLHKIIDEASEQDLDAIYAWISADRNEEQFYTVQEIQAFYGRLSSHQNGTSKSYSVTEAHNKIRNSAK
jgi:hypothetical protein